MRKNILILSTMLAFAFSISLAGPGFAKDEQITVTGNVICLLPDYEKGTVNPVIADGPCKNQPPHQHILVTNEGTVYYLQGLQEGLMKVQLNPVHKGVQVTGRAEQTPGGWILYVD
ncbi:MAG TPA: hypothetical protein PKC29_03835 [Thermodesulfobacteriota bacterium]|nr:hypothetical protein [Thermodesulfobacteriota bacterium]